MPHPSRRQEPPNQGIRISVGVFSNRIAWDKHLVPLSNLGVCLNWLCLKENQKVFARIKIDFVVQNSRNRFSQEDPKS